MKQRTDERFKHLRRSQSQVSRGSSSTRLTGVLTRHCSPAALKTHPSWLLLSLSITRRSGPPGYPVSQASTVYSNLAPRLRTRPFEQDSIDLWLLLKNYQQKRIAFPVFGQSSSSIFAPYLPDGNALRFLHCTYEIRKPNSSANPGRVQLDYFGLKKQHSLPSSTEAHMFSSI